MQVVWRIPYLVSFSPHSDDQGIVIANRSVANERQITMVRRLQVLLATDSG